MIQDASIKVRDYKCFGSLEQGFEKIFPINIIIGKNNSGKSSLIDLIEYITNPAEDFLNTKKSKTKCIVEIPMSQELFDNVIRFYASTQGSSEKSWREPFIKYVSDNKIIDPVKFIYHEHDIQFLSGKANYGQFEKAFAAVFLSFFSNKKFKRINAERDIQPDIFDTKQPLEKNGQGALNLVWKYMIHRNLDHNLIKKKLLSAVNSIINPDICFSDIMIKEEEITQRGVAKGEIYFEDEHENWIPLSKMGSGIKTILHVLLNLIVIPIEEHVPVANYVFGFEELENNLHPSLQRRLFEYIAEFADKYKCIFFITSHSNVVIDLFSKRPDAQIIHVSKKGAMSVANRVDNRLGSKNILKDLDFRASDLLMSNGVVWAEGPSDAIYIEFLLDLFNKGAVAKKSNYTIQSLATAIWKYAGFLDFKWDRVDNDIENKIISLSKVNINHLIILDRDNNYEDRKPSEFAQFKEGNGRNKSKLIYESMLFSGHDEADLINNYGDTKDGTLFFWVNDGTFETYLEHFIQHKGKSFAAYFDKTKTRGYFEKKRSGDQHSKSKVELAAGIALFATEQNLEFNDFAPDGSALSDKIERLSKTIRSWN